MSRALVTGGAGFIGLQLCRALVEEGWTVDIIDDLSRGHRTQELDEFTGRGRCHLLQIDLTDQGSTDRLDDDYSHIFHFAAILGVAKVAHEPERTLSQNVMMTIEALRLARRQRDLQTFLYASTSEVYAGSLFADLLEFPTPEDALLALPPLDAPRTSYMLSKIYGEALALHSGVPSVIVRPHNIYGPRMGVEHVIPELMKRMSSVQSGASIEIYSPTHSRTFCFIDDAVEMIIELARRPEARSQAWNIGCETPEVTIMELAERVRESCGFRVDLVPGKDTAGSPRRRAPSMAQTLSMTGKEDHVSLRDGIAHTYRWYQEHVFEKRSTFL